MLYNDGQYTSLRLGFGKDLVVHKHNHFGLELGVETGNSMRLNLPKSILDQLGGLPFQLKLKPVADLIATAKLQPKESGISVLFNARHSIESHSI